jgi:gas vesicle protein
MKGFAMGAALGAVAGILFAPAMGKQTQKKLMSKAHEIKGVVAAKAVELRKLSKEAYAKLVEEAVLMAKEKKMTEKEVVALKKDLLARYKDLKKKMG